MGAMKAATATLVRWVIPVFGLVATFLISLGPGFLAFQPPSQIFVYEGVSRSF